MGCTTQSRERENKISHFSIFIHSNEQITINDDYNHPIDIHSIE